MGLSGRGCLVGSLTYSPILRYGRATTAYGDSLVCVVDDDERGPVTVWLNTTVLLGQFRLLKPNVGETIGIKCLGKHPSGGVSPERHCWRFAVRVDRGQPELADAGIRVTAARETLRKAG